MLGEFALRYRQHQAHDFPKEGVISVAAPLFCARLCEYLPAPFQSPIKSSTICFRDQLCLLIALLTCRT